MAPIEMTLLISFAFAFATFIIASNFFKSFWSWLVSGIVAFAIVALTMIFDLEILFYVEAGIFVLMLIVTLMKVNLK